jgi:hypothetical protein
MAYYIIVSRGTYGSYKSEPHNVVQSLTGMSKQALVSPGGVSRGWHACA